MMEGSTQEAESGIGPTASPSPEEYTAMSVATTDDTQVPTAAPAAASNTRTATLTTSSSTATTASTGSMLDTTKTPRQPAIYHGIMEGYSVQFSDGPADPKSLSETHQYGQYTPPTASDTRRRQKEMRLRASHSEDDDSLPRFPIMNFPAELRLKIWEFAVADDTVELVDLCHDQDYDYNERTEHPWYTARCFFHMHGFHINGPDGDLHKKLETPGLRLLLVNKAVQTEVSCLLPKKRHFNIQAASVDCAVTIANVCPYVKSVAFPVPAFVNVLGRTSFAGRSGVQWWARYVARHLADFPENIISRVIFWTDRRPADAQAANTNGDEDCMIYHRLEFKDPEPGKERWNIEFIGFFGGELV
jgi:hypothetical protein